VGSTTSEGERSGGKGHVSRGIRLSVGTVKLSNRLVGGKHFCREVGQCS